MRVAAKSDVKLFRSNKIATPTQGKFSTDRQTVVKPETNAKKEAIDVKKRPRHMA